MTYQRHLSRITENNTYQINTLGTFSVFCNGNDLTGVFNKSMKIWDLFKYLLTFRDELMLPERIVQALWPDADYADPKRTLRALVFRLRKALQSEVSHGCELIVSSRGCYKFETKEYCTIDVVAFENFYRRACEAANYDTEEAVERFKQVNQMYKGDYLPETCGHDWLIPARNYYRRIFLQSTYEAAQLLKEQKRYEEIISLCESVFKHELFEEDLHLLYIEALAGVGKLKQARGHYEYVKDLLARELGVQPSDTLDRTYQMLFRECRECSRTGPDVNDIKNNQKEQILLNGPMLCDKEFFMGLHHLETRRAERFGPTSFLGLLTVSSRDNTLPGKKQLQEGMRHLKQILLSDLRKGDAITEWSESQFLLSLYSTSVEQAEVPLKRVQKKFLEQSPVSELVLNYQIMNTLPQDP